MQLPRGLGPKHVILGTSLCLRVGKDSYPNAQEVGGMIVG